jgi:NodT family efflux transporter outer membrane factor (OMF) lipoprotein
LDYYNTWLEFFETMEMKNLICSAALSTIILLSGCAGKVEPLEQSSLKLPTSFSLSGSTELAGKWWLAFGDDQLNTLIEQALTDNFSLKSAWERLSQAEALYRRNRAAIFPVIDGEASGSHSKNQTDGTTINTDRAVLGLSASYEVDLWGKIDSEIQASRLDMEASGADLDAAAMTLTAEIAGTWYLLIQQTASLRLLEEQIKTNINALELITAQFRTGQVPIADVLQQRQLIETQRGELELQLLQEGQTRHKLSVLMGQVPGSEVVEVNGQLIELPALPATGVPAEVLSLRPDVRSSFLALQSADSRVAAAVADQYPALRLTASLETVGSSTSTVFSDYLGSIMAGLTAPLLDGGRRKAEVERTSAVARERLHDYGQSLITAVGEVEDALLAEMQQQQYIQSLEMQLSLATQTMKQVKERYLKGVENYQRVLTALTSLQSLQQSKITAQKDLLLNRIELCRALGHGWDYQLMKDKS